MKTNLYLIAILCLFSIVAHSQTTITGKIVDSETKEPLSFASIAVPSSTTGTMTNAVGEFDLILKELQTEIQVSYIGYTDKIISIEEEKTEYIVALEPYAFDLQEVIVKSLTPLEYIQKALEKHPSLIPDKPFTTRSFFASKSSVKNDNTNSYTLNQAVFKTYFTDYANDTLTDPSQLILHKETKEGKFTSMLEENKRIKKLAKKGENEVSQDSTDTINESNISINDLTGAGPASVLEESKSITKLDFFDEEYFDKFTYTFGAETHFQGRELIRIDIVNKRKVDNTFYTGSVYLDHTDLAIVAIDYTAKLKIPFLINALLKTVIGFTLSGADSDVSIRNQYLDKWYPKEVVYNVDISLKQKGEIEVISMAQVLSIEEIIYIDPERIIEENIFDEEKEYIEQIFPVEGINWSDINIIKIE